MSKTTTKAKKTTKTTTNTQPKPKRLIYCGPNLPSGILQRYTVYKNGMPIHLQDIIQKCPSIARLFVEVEKFTETENFIAEKGTHEHLAFQEVINFIESGGMKE